jgi:hypothetical protein
MSVSGRRAASNWFRASVSWVCLILLPVTHGAASAATEKSDDKAARGQMAVGYSLLYQEATGIPKLDWLLSFKSKSTEMKTVTENLMGYYKTLSARMEALVKDYPAIELKAKTMPQIEEETRKSMGIDQAKAFAPVIGKSGVALEREALITFRSALDEQRHLVGVMLDKESVPALRDFLQGSKVALEKHYAQVDALLQRRYFTRVKS